MTIEKNVTLRSGTSKPCQFQLSPATSLVGIPLRFIVYDPATNAVVVEKLASNSSITISGTSATLDVIWTTDLVTPHDYETTASYSLKWKMHREDTPDEDVYAEGTWSYTACGP